MTTLAEDIKALIDLGHTLERATELATQDRANSAVAATHQASALSKAQLISVPGSIKFKLEAKDAVNSFNLQHKHSLLDMKRVVDESVKIVMGNVGKETTDTYRTPPLVLARLARGGKTTTLSQLFDRLKCCDCSPILISINGHGERAFRFREGESQSGAILRLIAAQLVECTQEEKHLLTVDKLSLDTYLGNKNVVLLIDELNRLTGGEALDSEAAEMLREMFLDRPGRYLVFTSHVVMGVDSTTAAFNYLGRKSADPSHRGIVTVNMSLATLGALRRLPNCRSLTSHKAAWYGHIPSLVLSALAGEELGNAVTPQTRFAQTHDAPDPELRLQILSRFVTELLTGERDAVVARYYGQFSSVGMDLKVSYPLCFVSEILKELRPDSKPVRALLRILAKLESASEQTGTGMDWEASVQLAVILRCMSSHYHGTAAPFDIVPDGVQPALEFLRLPQGCSSLPLSRDFIDHAVSICKVPTLFFIEATESAFGAIDGLVIYCNGEKGVQRTVRKEGFQAKAGDNQNVHQIGSKDSNHTHLFRGRVDAAKPRSTTQKKFWTYWAVPETAQFLGTSLLLSIPRDMLTDPVLVQAQRVVSKTVAHDTRARSSSTGGNGAVKKFSTLCDFRLRTATLSSHLLPASIKAPTSQEPAVYTAPAFTVYCYNTQISNLLCFNIMASYSGLAQMQARGASNQFALAASSGVCNSGGWWLRTATLPCHLVSVESLFCRRLCSQALKMIFKRW